MLHPHTQYFLINPKQFTQDHQNKKNSVKIYKKEISQ